jgi:hypothetical protein
MFKDSGEKEIAKNKETTEKKIISGKGETIWDLRE